MQRAQRPHPAAPTIIGIFQTETVLDRIDKAATPGDGLEREAGEDAAAASEAGGVQEQGWARNRFLFFDSAYESVEIELFTLYLCPL